MACLELEAYLELEVFKILSNIYDGTFFKNSYKAHFFSYFGKWKPGKTSLYLMKQNFLIFPEELLKPQKQKFLIFLQKML